MAAPPAGAVGGGPPALPGTDMTEMCFKDQLWLNSYPLDRNLVFDYFALSLCHLSKMTGIEFMLNEVMEPNLFVIRKQKRDGPEKVTPMLTYYVLDGSIFQAPQLCNVFATRVGCALYYISKAFTIATSKAEKTGFEFSMCTVVGDAVDAENENTVAESKASKERMDFKEVKRKDHILASLQHKALPPPPFPEGYTPPQAIELEKGPETQQAGEAQPPPIDPIIDQGPAKRMRF